MVRPESEENYSNFSIFIDPSLKPTVERFQDEVRLCRAFRQALGLKPKDILSEYEIIFKDEEYSEHWCFINNDMQKWFKALTKVNELAVFWFGGKRGVLISKY